MITATHDYNEYAFTLYDAPGVRSQYGAMQSSHMTVAVYNSGAAYIHIKGRAILKSGAVGKSRRVATFDLAVRDGSGRRINPPPSWILDILDKFPALALLSAQARERAAS